MSKKLAIGLVLLIVLGAGALFLSKSAPQPPTVAATAPEVIAPAAGDPTPPAEAAAPDTTVMENSASLLAPPAAMTAEVAAAMKDRVLGSDTAPVTIIEYSSLTCSHCAHFATKLLPEVKKRLIDTGRARLIYRDFPLDEFALKAAMMARCVPTEQYFNMVEVIFSNQERWAQSKDPLVDLAQLGSLAGLDADAFKKCTENKDLETAILNGRQEAQTKYNVKSTPMFIFNNGAEQISGAQNAAKFEGIVNKLTQGK